MMYFGISKRIDLLTGISVIALLVQGVKLLLIISDSATGLRVICFLMGFAAISAIINILKGNISNFYILVGHAIDFVLLWWQSTMILAREHITNDEVSIKM